MINNGLELISSNQDGKRWDFEFRHNSPTSLETVEDWIAKDWGLTDDLATTIGHRTFIIDRILLNCEYSTHYYLSRAVLRLDKVSISVSVTDKR